MFLNSDAPAISPVNPDPPLPIDPKPTASDDDDTDFCMLITTFVACFAII
jgi:hypothetical protein